MSLPLKLILLLAACACAAPLPLHAQDDPALPTPPPPSVADPSTPSAASEATLPSLDDLKALLEKAEGAIDPDDPATATLAETYREAVALLEAKATNEALTKSYADALITAPEASKNAQAELEALPEVDPKAEPAGLPEGLGPASTADEINQRLAEARANLLEQKKALADFESQVSAQQTRPDQVRDQMVEVQQQLSAAQSHLAELAAGAESSEADRAARILAQLREAGATAEQAALEQERVSHDSRVALLRAQRALADRIAAQAEAEVGVIQAFADGRLKAEVEKAAMTAEQAGVGAATKHPVVQEFAGKLTTLSIDFEAVAGMIGTVAAEAGEKERQLETLTRDFERMKNQISIGGMSGAQGEIVIAQWRRLPSVRAERLQLEKLRSRISESRLKEYEVQEKLRDDPDTAARKALEESGESIDSAAGQASLADLNSLSQKRRELLKRLLEEYQRLLGELNDLDLAQRLYLEKAMEVTAYLGEKILWVRSGEPLNLETWKNLPAGLHWLAGPDRAVELAAALGEIGRRSPLLNGLALLLFFGLLALRRRCRRALENWSHRVRKISTDRYVYTIRALLVTVLLAACYPLILAYTGWQLLAVAGTSDWLQGLGKGLGLAAYLLGVLFFVRELCREHGLASGHFRWHRRMMESLRENLTLLSIVHVPASVIFEMVLAEKDVVHLTSIGRLTFMAMMLWLAFCLRRMLDRKTGVLSSLIEERPGRLIIRLHGLWAFLFIGFPLVMCALAAFGYEMTGIILTRQFWATLEIIALGLVVHAMILRWFSMSERKLALDQRIRERRERLEAEAAQAEGGEAAMPVDDESKVDIEDETIDFEVVGEQTRRLLRLVVGAGVALSVWFAWSDIVPALRALDNVLVFGDVSLAELLPAVIILILTVIAAKNLPGLLEIAVLRHLPLDAGLRYAITSLCQYTVVAVGFFSVVGALGLDWAKFAWLAAALSVGLGFGLQEIVANFVCGIILLFERPIRVGDIVTIGDTTGTISRIRIRATTIVNWDRKELIVPNKEFITGRLLNWTLTSTLNRLILQVGVAYGSDTEKVRDLLLEICDNHPEILDDPPPRVIFDTFGDSTLNFTIRAYLASMENRLSTTDELNHEIHKRFGEEDIEIAFPQRDLHIRSMDPSITTGPSTGGKEKA